jgi:ATP/ADP translocase
MKKLTSNNKYETYYYPIKNNKSRKYLLLFLLAVFLTILIYFILGKKHTIGEENFTFE